MRGMDYNSGAWFRRFWKEVGSRQGGGTLLPVQLWERTGHRLHGPSKTEEEIEGAPVK